MTPKWIFFSKEIQIKVDVGAPCLSKKAIFETNVSKTHCAHYVSALVHYVHLFLAGLIFELEVCNTAAW